MAGFHGFLAMIGVLTHLGGRAILDCLQLCFDPAQVTRNFSEHQTATIAVSG